MSRLTAGGSRVRPMHKSGKLAGPALTVKTRPGDNLMLHKAIDLAEPADIIVCDAGGALTNPSLYFPSLFVFLTKSALSLCAA